MKIAILGYGDQGKSAYEYWNKDGNVITVCDSSTDTELPAGVTPKLGPDYLKELDQFDLLIRTPALHPNEIVKNNSPEILSKVTTNTNEFFKVSPSKNIIGVTGTKGKGTTSTLIAKMLEAAGHKVHLGGNIGIPPLELLKDNIQPDDWVVLELANFQLIDLQFAPKIAVCLMIASEHMDWHMDMQEYLSAKRQMFIRQLPYDTAIFYAKNENSKQIAFASPGQKQPYFDAPGAHIANNMLVIEDQQICYTAAFKLLGKHNWQNICAATTAAWKVVNNPDAIRQVVTQFTGLEHRLEMVRKRRGVKYYDDSFGTTPETAIVAIQAIKEPKVLILGGSDKGSSYEELAKTVAASNVKKVIVIGQMGPKIAGSLKNAGYTNIVDGGKTMKEIVKKAKKSAKRGDAVLFSTACASFDMFKNYKDRGEQFKKAVSALW